MYHNFLATFTAKTLGNALTLARKGAKIRTGDKWLETTDHKYGTDHVLIRVANGQCTLYTVSQPGEGQACTFVRCDRLAHVAYIDGELALPIRTLHDYVKTFSASDEIRIAGDDVRVVEDTPASHTYHTEANTYKRIRTEIPATYRDEHAIIVTSGRNRARIIGKPLASLAWMGDALLFGQVTPTEQAAADHAAMLASITPVRTAPAPITDAKKSRKANPNSTKAQKAAYQAAHQEEHDAHASEEGASCDWQPAVILGPAYVAPLGTPPGLSCDGFGNHYDWASLWHAHCDMIARTTERPTQPTTDAPTPIRAMPAYTAVVGDTVSLTYAHENGTTTDRVVTIHRMTASGFRGYDHTYRKARNYHFDHITRLVLHTGEEDIAAG